MLVSSFIWRSECSWAPWSLTWVTDRRMWLTRAASCLLPPFICFCVPSRKVAAPPPSRSDVSCGGGDARARLWLEAAFLLPHSGVWARGFGRRVYFGKSTLRQCARRRAGGFGKFAPTFRWRSGDLLWTFRAVRRCLPRLVGPLEESDPGQRPLSTARVQVQSRPTGFNDQPPAQFDDAYRDFLKWGRRRAHIQRRPLPTAASHE